MINLPLLIRFAYLVIGFLVVRQLLKRNIFLRCKKCRKFGTLKETLEIKNEQLKEIEILDAAELPRLPSDHPVYKCKNCGTVFHFN